jgi:hypothetical protein
MGYREIKICITPRKRDFASLISRHALQVLEANVIQCGWIRFRRNQTTNEASESQLLALSQTAYAATTGAGR